MADALDLTEYLAEAVAVRTQRSAITSDAGVLTGVTLIIAVASDGAVIDTITNVECRAVHRSRRIPSC